MFPIKIQTKIHFQWLIFNQAMLDQNDFSIFIQTICQAQNISSELTKRIDTKFGIRFDKNICKDVSQFNVLNIVD